MVKIRVGGEEADLNSVPRGNFTPEHVLIDGASIRLSSLF